MGNSSQANSIHILDNDSLLNIFYLYRPAILDGDENENEFITGGKDWDRERWWYRLAHVCKRWRILLLASTSYLGLSLVCTYGTPVADMLAHSPPLPLLIDYFNQDRNFTAEDEAGMILALQQRGRIRRIRLVVPVPSLLKIILAIDEEFPILEYLIIMPPTENRNTPLIFPETFRAPRLRHLLLEDFTLPIGSPLLTTAMGLVTLCLFITHPSAYFQPNTLHQWLSSMPQLDTFWVSFSFPSLSHDVEAQVSHAPIMTHITLPNLRWFVFRGVSAYLDALVRRITAPRLEKLQIEFFEQLTFSIPGLMQFIGSAENLRFDSADFEFSDRRVRVELYHREVEACVFSTRVYCWHLDWQVSSVAQIFNSISQISSAVEHLTLRHKVHGLSPEEHNEVDHAEWRRLIRSFSNVKTLSVDDGLVEELSRFLRLDEGESPSELLPELQELICSGSAFTSFIHARQIAGSPVALVRPNISPVTPRLRSPSPGFPE